MNPVRNRKRFWSIPVSGGESVVLILTFDVTLREEGHDFESL